MCVFIILLKYFIFYFQSGPGYIYFLRNFVITPQKLHKASYKPVIG